MTNNTNGARFKAASFFRPTAMSDAMARAGIIPAGHLIREMASVAVHASGRRVAM